jgi:hypothetical protein
MEQSTGHSSDHCAHDFALNTRQKQREYAHYRSYNGSTETRTCP